MTNKILLDKFQDCISFYKKNPGNPDLKEIVFSRLEFLDHQEFFEANVLYIGTLPRFQALYAPELASPEALFLLSETTEAQLAQLSLPASGRIMISTLPQERLFNRISARSPIRYPSVSFSPDEVWQQILDRKLVAADDIMNALFPDNAAPGFYVQLLLFHPEDSDIHTLFFALQALLPS